MSIPITPAELYRHSLRLLRQKDLPAWLDLWDDDGVLEFPFTPEGWPHRLEGKAAVSDYTRRYPDHVHMHDFPDVRIHQGADPETIVVDMRGDGGLAKADNSPFGVPYIAVVKVKDGLITCYRAYWNPLVVSQPGVDYVQEPG
ncbi:nuclear transport factor 2 family protein [Streptomyces sp. RKAG293]|uniref:nuclear transport factor 2 family protein n=1 Tax=Streptomyces sp. RKAG293 TaxID=2893403 RepID=UPI0020336FC1|nr:nuclear transport factor 2 family protein [Streptomyces sp. RKAG293]MCM2422651.1 nuclear transport factor 2 family protein [Streptomyces sp. RKAG293]